MATTKRRAGSKRSAKPSGRGLLGRRASRKAGGRKARTNKRGARSSGTARPSRTSRSSGAARTARGGSAARGGSGAGTARGGRSRSGSESLPDGRAAIREGVLWEHAADLCALGLFTLGVLLALAVYGNALGPVGHGIDTGLGDAIGVIRFLIPATLVGSAVAIVIARGNPDPLRSVIGAALGLVATAGLAELAGGRPKVDAPSHALASAGGWLGAIVGRPLADGLEVAGASVLLVAVLLVGLVIATGISLRTLGRSMVSATRAVSSWVRGRLKARPGTPVSEDLGGAGRHAQLLAAGEVQAVADGAEDPLARAGSTERAAEPYDGFAHEDAPAQEELPGSPTGVPSEASGFGDAAESVDGTPSGQSKGRAAARAPGPMAPASTSTEWILPSAHLLKTVTARGVDDHLVDIAGESLVAALAAHGVEMRLVGRTVGPTVTRFELELGPGVKVARVTSLSRDIAYAMASPEVRILAPIPGRSAIGVEVPNRRRELVTLGNLLQAPEVRRARHPLDAVLGRDISGRALVTNLADMPHVLISGATGAGKSSCINSLLCFMLMRATPDQVRMILIDPKRVELGQYNDLPHLLTQVVVDPKKAANALQWAVKEMERRYDLLAEYGMRDITSYNEAFDRGEIAAMESVSPVEESETDAPQRLPFVLVVVDELNDLMMVAARDVEESVCRIAQMARAVGIHLVIATQRPSVDVITGVIKANIPARMAFSVSSLADSRVILDQPGAERLIGKGDMLLLTASSSVPQRLQTPWVSETEIRQVVAHWRRQRLADRKDEIGGLDQTVAGSSEADDDDDELLPQAMELVVNQQMGSTSMLQRKLRVGFARAGRLMDLLERKGVVGPSEGSKARAVLMTPEELERIRC